MVRINPGNAASRHGRAFDVEANSLIELLYRQWWSELLERRHGLSATAILVRLAGNLIGHGLPLGSLGFIALAKLLHGHVG